MKKTQKIRLITKTLQSQNQIQKEKTCINILRHVIKSTKNPYY